MNEPLLETQDAQAYREGDPNQWSAVLITALGSWEKPVPWSVGTNRTLRCVKLIFYFTIGYATGAAGVTSFIRWAEQPGPQAESRHSAWLEYDWSTLLRHSSSSHLANARCLLICQSYIQNALTFLELVLLVFLKD
jgi:hypothetical protein